MRLVVIESPFAGTSKPGSPEWMGEVRYNIKYLRACMADCLARGEAPFASHALYTQPGVLDDTIPVEREKGILAGFAWGEKAEARVVYTDQGISSGMKAGIVHAEGIGQPVEMRKLGAWDV